jgi:hypothetical protein
VVAKVFRGIEMGERLPLPAKPARPSPIIDESEMEKLQEAAEQSGLSVASLIRVLIVESCEHVKERVEEWKKIAERIRQDAPPDQPKPGRPKKNKKPKK